LLLNSAQAFRAKPFVDECFDRFWTTFRVLDPSQPAHAFRENCASRRADLPVARRSSIAMGASLPRSSTERAPTIGLTIST
jgi:hypothetical protein